ncbi:DUF1127 domain-containing protein [Sabulicella glaciei]|uniref:DUF1127 domain-containing protein n=1 Tax=Sabulicella glaciei TaxID=2984948 RepID=A0ABT3NPF6_9PROT|nr:DUF1127 domain-containing protein [Roseococcus sp. MDT2-1-1]MCW8084040.1 DUF1127 domain-containing protein [Roseococcus sp. MDT2-1-1]
MTTIGFLIDGLVRIQERARGRRLLLEMDARLLKDIGLTEAIAEAEAAKPWWRH